MTPTPEQELAQRLRALNTPAPPGLRARVTQLIAEADRRPRRGRWQAPVLGAAAALAAALILVLVLASPSSTAPTVPGLARFALTAATGPPPAVDPADPGRLRAHVGPLAFPRWGRAVGFSPVGARSADVAGRRVVGVAYRSLSGAEVGYAIAATPPVDPGAGAVQTVYGRRYTISRTGGAITVTWRQSGHTCVLASRGVPAATLVGLASTWS